MSVHGWSDRPHVPQFPLFLLYRKPCLCSRTPARTPPALSVSPVPGCPAVRFLHLPAVGADSFDQCWSGTGGTDPPRGLACRLSHEEAGDVEPRVDNHRGKVSSRQGQRDCHCGADPHRRWGASVLLPVSVLSPLGGSQCQRTRVCTGCAPLPAGAVGLFRLGHSSVLHLLIYPASVLTSAALDTYSLDRSPSAWRLLGGWGPFSHHGVGVVFVGLGTSMLPGPTRCSSFLLCISCPILVGAIAPRTAGPFGRRSV